MTDMADAVPSLPIQVRVRRFRGKLRAARGEVAIELDGSSAILFAGIDGRRSVAQIAELLVAEYDIPHDMALADTAEFLSGLIDAKFVELGT